MVAILAMATLVLARFADAGVIAEGINFSTGEKRIAYEVERGDTLGHIGRKVISKKVTSEDVWKRITAPNGIKNPRKLKIGIILIIQVPLSEVDRYEIALQRAEEENIRLEKQVIVSRIALREKGSAIANSRNALAEARETLSSVESDFSNLEEERDKLQSQNEKLVKALHELSWFSVSLVGVTFFSILVSILLYSRSRTKEEGNPLEQQLKSMNSAERQAVLDAEIERLANGTANAYKRGVE